MKGLKILNVILKVLFVEAILFLPIVLLVATAGHDFSRILRYAILFVTAFIPHIIWKKTQERLAISGCQTFLFVSICLSFSYLVYFTGFLIASCAGHPPL